MKNAILASLVSLFAVSAFADNGSILCESKSSHQVVHLSIDEMSELSVQGAALKLNRKETKVTGFAPQQTEYGVLSIQVTTGKGRAAYNYRFQNLGSSECFGVYGSKQSGAAFVEVYNALGKIAKLTCECDAD